MSSNLPPGVTDSMIPGNRPEDQEFEIVLTKDDIYALRDFYLRLRMHPSFIATKFLSVIEGILEQADKEMDEMRGNKNGPNY